MAMRSLLELKRHRESHILFSVPENYGFDTIVIDYYSYYPDQNSYQLFPKP
jgi:hypothetical protein